MKRWEALEVRALLWLGVSTVVTWPLLKVACAVLSSTLFIASVFVMFFKQDMR